MPARSCWAAASPPTRRCAPGWPARRRPAASRSIVPRPALCTDNGAMIGAAGARRFAAGERAGLDLGRPTVAAAGGPVSRSTASRASIRPPSGPRCGAAGLRARHALSQNFLADPDVLEAILAEADPPPGRRVLEIGPGLGLLTGGLLAAGAEVTAVELDRGLAAFLRERFDGRRRSLRLIEGDALDQDLVQLVEPPYDVVANLPYHITSPILHALLGAPPRPERLVLMVQREVAERIAAPPGKMSYLSVFVQYHARVRIAFGVPAGGVRAGARGRVGGHRRRAVRRRRPARPGDRGRAVAPGPGRLPRAAQDDPQRPVAPAPARCGPGDRGARDGRHRARPAPADPRGGGVAGPARGARPDRPRGRGRRAS